MQKLEGHLLPKAIVAISGWAIVMGSILYLVPSEISFGLLVGLAGFPVALLLALMLKPEHLWVIVVLSFLSLPYLDLRAEIGNLLVPVPAFLASSALVGLLARPIFGGPARQIDRRLLAAWAFFLAGNLLSVYNSASLFSSASALAKWTFHGILFVSLISTLRGHKNARLLTLAFVAVMTMMSMTGLYRYLVLETAPDIDLFSEIGTRTASAYYLVITLPLGIAVLWDTMLSRVKRGLVLLAVTVSAVTLMFTFTRAGWITVIVVLLISGFYQRRAWLLLAGAIAVVALAAPQTVLDRFSSIYVVTESRGSPHRSSSIVRYYLLLTAGNMILDHPLIGVGVGTYEVNYHRYHEAGATVSARLPHNEYLRTWAEGGIGALAALLWIAYMIVSRLVRGVARARDARERSLLLGYLGSALSVFVYNFFSNNLNTMLTWLILAVGVVLTDELEEESHATVHHLRR